MSEIKNAVASFLDEGGRSLGYDEDNLPRLSDFRTVCKNLIKVWEYNGMTEYEYYGGTDTDKKKVSSFKSIGRIIRENKMDTIDYWEHVEDSIIDSMENK